MSAEIIPIGNYLPPLELETVVQRDEPATLIVLPVIRIERVRRRRRERAQEDDGLPSDCQP